ncbi:cbb3-type cytochrome c oxidase subunit I [Yoonia sp. SS1-5]|uniref:Cbb3-type cytochrome c oxidase subunit I n=1 Tax=Yoonia rhodophyticola TaxID=3137370 RepID=A0AAN0M702_9RHOB
MINVWFSGKCDNSSGAISLIYYAVCLLCLIVAPLLANIRGWKPAALFFAVAAVYAVFGAVSFAQMQIALSHVREAGPAYDDTYYVVSRGHFLWNIGIAMAVFGAITWIQTRFGAMLYPTLTKILFWVLHVALIGITSFQGVLAFVLSRPWRYFDYPDFIETYVQIGAWSGFLSQVAVIGLLCLLLWSIIAKSLIK